MPQKTTVAALCVITSLLACFLAACASHKPTSSSSSSCPNLASGETVADCPWADVARDLAKVSDSSGNVRQKLESDLPLLVTRFEADRARPEWLALWGRSVNFDEYAKGEVVPPAIIKALLEELNGPAPAGKDSRIMHAGIEHTYGYLFSNLKTPFGFKRARWVLPTIDQAFGFADPTISPLPSDGTLLGNVTYFAGRIAFRGEKDRLAELARYEMTIAPALRTVDYEHLGIRRLEERVKLPRPVVIRTDIIPFPQAVAGDPNSFLLVYSVHDESQGGSVLISLFPVTKSFVEMALNPKGMGTKKPVVSRYNAAIDGLTGQKNILGSRKVLNPPAAKDTK